MSRATILLFPQVDGLFNLVHAGYVELLGNTLLKSIRLCALTSATTQIDISGSAIDQASITHALSSIPPANIGCAGCSGVTFVCSDANNCLSLLGQHGLGELFAVLLGAT
mgnify:CR=1 FL=1